MRAVSRVMALLGLAAVLAIDSGTPGALAQDAPAAGDAIQEDELPLLVNADELIFDDVQNLIIARGNVELAREGRILTADEVRYDQNADVVVAVGNVRIIDVTDDVFFADYVELTGDFGEGFADNIRMLIARNERIAGTRGYRSDGRFTEMEGVVYSPCELCEDDPDRAPIWQVKALRVIHDQERRDVIYRNAWIEFFGVPVIWTPYFRHPDPTVERRTGFLRPDFGSTSYLGAFIRPYYYIDIAPDMDLTLEALASAEQGPLIGAEFRKRFASGEISVRGSITQSERTVGSPPNRRREDRIRGHLFADGSFDLTENWRTGFRLRRTSDRTYADDYDYSSQDILRNRLFAEGFFGRDYTAIEHYYFQDTRFNPREQQPLVLPLARYSHSGEPGSMFGGHITMDAGVYSLFRSEGADSQRFSLEGAWNRRLTTNFGLVTDLEIGARGDLFVVDDLPLEQANGTASGAEGRIVPYAQAQFRYPVARQTETMYQVIEPIVGFTFSPQVSDKDRIPNEDSRDVEFDAGNIFDRSRFPGHDRIEGGSRVDYGLRASIDTANGFGSAFLGQSYRFSGNDQFPEGSGLDDRLSDIVGEVQLAPGDYLDLNYRFRLDKNNFSARRHELRASAGVPLLHVSTRYLFGEQFGRGDDAPTDRQQLDLAVRSQITDNWSLRASVRHDLSPDPGTQKVRVGATYQDECFTFDFAAERDFTERDEFSTGDTFFIRLSCKNLGEFALPEIARDSPFGLFGGLGD